MAEHTPGPWIDWDTLEWLHDPKKLLTNTEDALLIAAAPDLLEALDDCVDRLVAAFPAAENYPPIQKARAAISKATGGK